jgi:hypothetical protein
LKQPAFKTPTITLDGKEYTAKKRKMIQLRLYASSLKNILPAIQPLLNLGMGGGSLEQKMEGFFDAFSVIGEEENLNKCAEFIAATINHPEVSAERVLEELEGEEVIPLLVQCAAYVRTFVDMQVEQAPKK